MSDRWITIAPLTRGAFAPFGTVIDKGVVAPRPMNGGRARRFRDLASVPITGGDGTRDGQVVIGYVEAEPFALPLSLSLVERHPLGAQAFIPVCAAPFLVVVCPDEGGTPGRPRAFLTAPGQGVCYHVGTWHGLLTPLDRSQDFWVIDRGGVGLNLEEHRFGESWTIIAEPA